ncbi:hypothetical protein [Oleisolibacter albus]|uniref:hypothetical protein n=1 Tax=Oleisolibacter albus TaxID=2171757 RepID=UPI000DF3D0CF|nr:hypothetical protein [Oleisolibacter albus]
MAGSNGRNGDQSTNQGPDRRDLLRGAVLAGAAGIAATAVAAPMIQGEKEAVAEQLKPRYRETEHVKRFYFLNRL